MVNSVLKSLLYSLLPGYCLLCRQPSGTYRDLCRRCALELPTLNHCCRCCALPLPATETTGLCGGCQRRPFQFSRCLAAWPYQHPIDHLITRFKHHREFAAGEVLAQLWLDINTARVRGSRPDVLMAVPLHWRRRWQRSFNQSILLAESWSNALDIPVAHHLKRHRHTPPQQALSANQRQRNLRGAFHIDQPARLANKHIALIDDVVTTAATANTLSAMLLDYGARQVDIWCLARTPEH